MVGGKYRIDKILGEGGMGVVYEGLDTYLARPVALKYLHAEFVAEQSVVRRFFDEARAAAALDSENVIAVHDLGFDPVDQAPFIVLELLRGESLAARFERGVMGADEAIALLAPVMEALADAHRNGIVHRDLKPENVFLSHDRKGRVVPKVLDFGIAKILNKGNQTTIGQLLGTPAYMAPEQALGRPVGKQADVWSMGVILYQAMSGRMHLDIAVDDPAMIVAARVGTTAPTPLALRASWIPEPVAAAVDRALARDPSIRYASMEEFLDALRDALSASGSSSVRESRPHAVVADSNLRGRGTAVLPRGSTLALDAAHDVRRTVGGAILAGLGVALVLLAAALVFSRLNPAGDAVGAREPDGAASPARSPGVALVVAGSLEPEGEPVVELEIEEPISPWYCLCVREHVVEESYLFDGEMIHEFLDVTTCRRRREECDRLERRASRGTATMVAALTSCVGIEGDRQPALELLPDEYLEPAVRSGAWQLRRRCALDREAAPPHEPE